MLGEIGKFTVSESLPRNVRCYPEVSHFNLGCVVDIFMYGVFCQNLSVLWEKVAVSILLCSLKAITGQREKLTSQGGEDKL